MCINSSHSQKTDSVFIKMNLKTNLNIEKIIFKVVKIKFLAMHINDQKFSFDIFMVENVLNIFMEHGLNILLIFGVKEKSIILC